MWISAAVLSAFFGGVSTILVKCGVKNTDSNLATALRTVVVFLFSWMVVFISGPYGTISSIAPETFAFLMLSGISTGISWACYLKALSLASVNKVVPVDKSSTIISVFLAIIIFGETTNLVIKIICAVILAIGIILMVEKKDDEKSEGKSWIIYAALSAVFGALSSIFAKPGFKGVDSNLGNALRAVIILIMIWIVVFAKGRQAEIKMINKSELLFIGFSGIATGSAWLCYYYAIQNGIVSAVVPIDRLSILVSIVFSRIVFKEKLSRKGFIGLILIIAATVTMAIKS